MKQGKTSTLVRAPLLPDLPELKAMLDETPRVSTIIVIDEKTKRPYTLYNLSKSLQRDPGCRSTAHRVPGARHAPSMDGRDRGCWRQRRRAAVTVRS